VTHPLHVPVIEVELGFPLPTSQTRKSKWGRTESDGWEEMNSEHCLFRLQEKMEQSQEQKWNQIQKREKRVISIFFVLRF